MEASGQLHTPFTLPKESSSMNRQLDGLLNRSEEYDLE